jgi:hypothetical protein
VALASNINKSEGKNLNAKQLVGAKTKMTFALLSKYLTSKFNTSIKRYVIVIIIK